MGPVFDSEGANEPELLQSGQPPQRRCEGDQPRVADAVVAQREGLQLRQGAAAQGGGECLGASVAHMHRAENEARDSRQRARPKPLR